jgi:hypothetical protein
MAANTDRKRTGLRVCLLQFLALVALAVLINAFFGPKPLWAVVTDGRSLAWQVTAGVSIALAFSIPAWIAVLKINVFGSFRTQILGLAGRLDLGGLNPLWFGLCAGFKSLQRRGGLEIVM